MQPPTIKDANIIPEAYQMRLMAWRDEFTRGYFEIGDIANEIILMNIQTDMKTENTTIYAAIGRFCGKSGRTVRDYAEIAAFFPENVRKYYDMLPFSHFRYAKTCGIKWQDVLEYSMEHPDASEDKLSYEFESVAASESRTGIGTVASVSVDDKMFVAASVAAEDSDVAASVAVGLSGIYVLANLISQVETVLSWELKKETRRKLVLALDGLKDVLRELSDKEPSLRFDYQSEGIPPIQDSA
jgi:hypothetical protein